MGRFIEKGDKPWLWGGGGIVAGLAIGFAIAHVHTLQEWRWDIIAQPLATLGAGTAAIIAAAIALHNGEKTREQDKEIHETSSRAEQERALRERFTSIVELLATEDLTKRESGAYALAALADDWAAFYKDDTESSLKEQQVCLNILTGELRDPILKDSDLKLLTFKERVQDIIFFKFINQENNGPGPWSNLELDLSISSLYKPRINGFFNEYISFAQAELVGSNISFEDGRFYSQVDFSFTSFREPNIKSIKRNTEFYSIHFEKAYFEDEVIFTGTDFGTSELISFDKAIFKKGLNIGTITIKSLPGISFDEAEFHEGITYAYAPELEKGAPFDRPKGIFSFNQAKFNLPENDPQIKYLKDLENSFEGAEFGVDFSK